MPGVSIEIPIDEALVAAVPQLRPYLGQSATILAGRVLAPPPVEPTARYFKPVTWEEFLAKRLRRPEGIPPVTLEDMERGIIEGALDGNV